MHKINLIINFEIHIIYQMYVYTIYIYFNVKQGYLNKQLNLVAFRIRFDNLQQEVSYIYI